MYGHVYGHADLAWKKDSLCLHRGRKLCSIVPDRKYPQMWRVQRPDGSLTDMLNLTRAKDAAVSVALTMLNKDHEKRP